MGEAQTVGARPEEPNVLFGVIVSIVVALVSSVVWFAAVVITNYQLGIVAVVVGFIMGFCVLKATGGRTSRSLQLTAVAITLLAMVLSQYLIVNHFINRYLDEEGEGGYLPLLLSPAAMAGIVYDSVVADPLTLLFWGIAVYEVYRRLEPKKIAQQTTSI